MIVVNNKYVVDYDTCLKQSMGDNYLYFELAEDEKLEIEREYQRLESKTIQSVGFYEAIKVFKDYLPILVNIKLEYVKDTNPVWQRVKNLLNNEGTLDVEHAKEIPIEQVCENLGVKLNKVKSITPFVHGATNPNAFSIKDNKFKCFRTGKRGTSIDLVMEILGKNFTESVKFLNNL